VTIQGDDGRLPAEKARADTAGGEWAPIRLVLLHVPGPGALRRATTASELEVEVWRPAGPDDSWD